MSAISASFHVYIDGQVLIKSTEFIDALAKLLAAIYVFNVEFPKGLIATYQFLHGHILALSQTKSKMSVLKLGVKVKK